MKNTYVVKIGSNTILGENGINKDLITKLSQEIKYLKDNGVNIVLVSSGAVALGKKELGLDEISGPKCLEDEQIFSSIGQAHLINTYADIFKNQDIKVSQALFTRKDFDGKESYNSMKKVFLTSLELGVLPIINENDVLSQEELDFSDNDELACLVAGMLDADKLIILSNVDGLYDRHPEEGGQLIEEVKQIDEKIIEMANGKKSNDGKGGMLSKIYTAEHAMEMGVDMYIANGYNDNNLMKIYSGINVGTRFGN